MERVVGIYREAPWMKPTKRQRNDEVSLAGDDAFEQRVVGALGYSQYQDSAWR